ncbi:DUF4179 domain-containing protein [Bacillus sp. 2205SS5-2]|uniref:DUF4179 domain-containing protein n=1 Tax=Bacillus sp. 2205SS5-2 TaxID=3109031 RepID=UPI0030071D44
MNIGNANAISVRKNKVKDINSFVNWFDERKKTFYKMALAYLDTPQDIEEVYYQTIIKVHEELHFLTEDVSIEPRVLSIFIENCRRVVKNKQITKLKISEGSSDIELQQTIFHSLQLLEFTYKDPIVLTYLIELPQDEVVHLLQISEETLKMRLLTGIQFLCKEKNVDNHLHGCDGYHEKFLDHLGRKLSRSEKIDLEMHLHNCQACQNQLTSIQDVIFSLISNLDNEKIPPQFMERIKNKVIETERIIRKTKLKRRKLVVGVIGILSLIVYLGVVTNSFTNLYYSWLGWVENEDEQLIAYLKSGLGEPLNLESESNGVKVTIKSAIADEVQTLIYYEIENEVNENLYKIDYFKGVVIENMLDILHHDPLYIPPYSEVPKKKEEKEVYKGRISLPPTIANTETIKLRLTQLEKLILNEPDSKKVANELPHFIQGDWHFNIPVTKHPSTVHSLDLETEIDGIPIKFDKLTIAPTATLIQYSYQNTLKDKRIDFINMAIIDKEKEKVKTDIYRERMYYEPSYENWITYQSIFEPINSEEPKEIKVQFGSLKMFIGDEKIVDIEKSSNFPQTFNYQGSSLSIKEVKIGNPTEISISDELTKDREYERLDIQVSPFNESEEISTRSDGIGVLFDQSGKKIDTDSYHFDQTDQLNQPRHFYTNYNLKVRNVTSNEKIIPNKIKILGYFTTKYLEEIIDIPLD